MPDMLKDQQWASVDEELELGSDTAKKMGQGDRKTLMCHCKDFVFYFEKMRSHWQILQRRGM